MQGGERRWTLRRNCSVSPRQFLAGLAAVAAGTVAVSGILAALGIWMVLPFCIAELAGLAAAGLAFARHARDGEVITLREDGTMVVEVQQGGGVTRHVFNRAWVRLVRDGQAPCDSALWLHYRGERLRLARHLDYGRLLAFEQEMRGALPWRGPPPARDGQGVESGLAL